MQSYTEYFRQRLKEQNARIHALESNPKYTMPNITCKKRKYTEAMGYKNYYEFVKVP
jgi:hypothetical protein